MGKFEQKPRSAKRLKWGECYCRHPLCDTDALVLGDEKED